MSSEKPLERLLSTLPQIGQVRWIGLSSERKSKINVVEQVMARVGTGLDGDHHCSSGRGKRQVTLIQHEHLAAIASLTGRADVDPSVLRRNIAVSGLNLLALKGRRFRVGEALLEFSGPAEPCSRMEDALGAGGYNAVRGHGGITARVVEEGQIQVGDQVAIDVARAL